ncbi:MAG TPA: glutamine-hydrolyzing GMP synthase [Thermotoga sp.]|nr:glutamine-hydrolyzing GMP synthase [Thermotoga sp.]
MKKVLILDYGSQYTQLIARKVRELGIFSEIASSNSNIDPSLYDLVILSGGPLSVYEKNALSLPKWFHSFQGKVLAICYGMQLISKEFGGKVVKGIGEYGRTKIRITRNDPLFDKLPKEFSVWMSHGDRVEELPKGFYETSKTEKGVISSATDYEKYWLLQFHPEVHHTEYGKEILKNFLFKIGKLKKEWCLENIVQSKINFIRDVIGNSKAIMALSGGVDSTVAGVMVQKAIGNNFIGILVDHGFLREGERKEIIQFLKNKMRMNIVVVDAKEEFLNKLKGVKDPEKKRKIIGETFIRVFEKMAKKFKAEFLVQGTIYPDVVESAGSGKNTSKIKSHHNVGGLPEKIGLRIVEPLRDFFKDEVRKIGKILKIPDEILNRHPFPGPGLAVRIIGEVTEERLEILKKVDKIFLETLKKWNLYDKVWQAFTVLLPIKSVGVKGDRRSYGYVVVLRAVDSVDGMTADWIKFPYDFLDEASKRITGEISEITRVVYDITMKPPATIEWE